MLELYQAYGDYHDMMDLAEDLVARERPAPSRGATVSAVPRPRARL